MRRILAQGPELPLHDLVHTRRLEAAALGAVPPHTLMRRAGTAVARLALALAPHAQMIRVFAGPGNNGGDGLEAALELQRLGKPVEVLRLGEARSADALDALQRARAAGVAIDPPAPVPLGAPDLVIDALLGIGATRSIEGPLRQAIEALAALPCPVLAVDLPSGLDADTGQPAGGACVQARHTLTLLTLKPGLFTAQGRDRAGTVWLDTLGASIDDGTLPEAWLYRGSQPLGARRHAQHKGSFGDVAVVGGAPGMAGAALLAARAAHAAGAGRVFVQLLGDPTLAFDPGHPELMLRGRWTEDTPPAVLATTTVVCGCGGGDSVRSVLPRLLSQVQRLVLDADALNAIAADEALQTLLRERAARAAVTVLTPHPLEAARLLGLADGAAVQADRLAAAKALAERYRCIVLLKGSGTVVATPGHAPRINASGNVSLASAGTGDVLAGWLGGHWSQRDEADALERGRRAAAHSAWLHGAAADEAALPVLRAAPLIERMAAQAAR